MSPSCAISRNLVSPLVSVALRRKTVIGVSRQLQVERDRFLYRPLSLSPMSVRESDNGAGRPRGQKEPCLHLPKCLDRSSSREEQKLGGR